MKSIYKAIILISVSLIAYHSQAQSKQDTTMMVNGVCNMCKQVIEESSMLEGVYSAEWSPETKVLQLSYDPEKITLAAIGASINKSGYDTEYNTADEEAYQSLHRCCHYRDPEVVKDHQ